MSVNSVRRICMKSNHNHGNMCYIEICESVTVVSTWRTINEMKLSRKVNLIPVGDYGVTCDDLFNQFVVWTTIAEQIVKNRNQYEQIDSSTQKHNFVTLEIKIKVIHLIMKKENAKEVWLICKTDRKTAKKIFKNRGKLFNLENVGALLVWDVQCMWNYSYWSWSCRFYKLCTIETSICQEKSSTGVYLTSCNQF